VKDRQCTNVFFDTKLEMSSDKDGRELPQEQFSGDSRFRLS